jgi:rfaE bifunctional protein kinase chain/domain
LEPALAQIARARVAVLGDFAVDAYWDLEPDSGEVSLETGRPVWRVLAQRTGLGGAGNVAWNLRALGAASVHAIGVVGNDAFGRELRALLDRAGIDREFVRDDGAGWQTLVYAKPHRAGVEQNRIDFGRTNQLGDDACAAVGEALAAVASRCDAMVVNQQIDGFVTDALIARIHAVVARHPRCRFVVDARDRAGAFRGVVLKMNAAEAQRLSGAADSEAAAARIATERGAPVFVTCGADGVVVADGTTVHAVPGIPVPPPIDPVGAGDTATAAIAAVLGGGGDALTAARVANLAAAVTVRKLRTTGTATPDELRALARQAGPT